MPDDTKQSYWYCDGCERSILHGEFRFNCTVCENYDYCEQCAATLDPPHPHRLVPKLAYGREERWECTKIDVATGIRAAMAMYWDRHCMGTRDVDKHNPSIYADTYSWFTFKTIADRSKNFGHGLRRLIEPRGYLSICAANRPEWMITDFACIFQSIISVPIYTLFTDGELTYVINNTKVSVVVCDKLMLSRFIAIQPQCPSLKHIVCMDSLSDSIDGSKSNDLSIHSMDDIEKNGSIKKYEYFTIEPDDCLTIIYTSGSSGFPKGVMLSEGAFRASFPQWCLPSHIDRVILSYRPLAWAGDRNGVITTFLLGGRTGFSTADPSRLMEEIALVRPTYFSGPPGIWNKIYSEFNTALALMTAQHPPETMPDEEERLLQQFSKLLANRCRYITIGGAMVSPAVLQFMKQCFTRSEVHESYGISECGGVTYNNRIDYSVKYRLESVPDMGYTLHDQPYPRGELLTKTPQMFSGYINNPEETAAAITDDGFYRTGDIVELRTKGNGQPDLHIIDRKKNFFKLSQGQFVSPEHLQSIYIQSPFVEQIYIHGDLLADTVSAVVVPNRNYSQSYAREHHIVDFDMNNPHSQFGDAVLQDLRSIGEKESLRKHEIPSRIIIDFHPFTSENGLLTSTLKPCRHKLAAHYSDRLKTSNDNIEQRLKTIIEIISGQSISKESEKNVFSSVGGDSLSAVRFSRMIENDLGIPPLPLNILFDPQMTLQRLTTLIRDPSQLSSFSQSIVPQLIKDSSAELNITVDGCKPLDSSPSMVFVTGTTGFVGSFLLAQLLTSYPSECKFVCLVRCDTSMNPIDRIRETMSFYQIWNDDYQQRIIALRGDLSRSHFSLNESTYQSLVDQIDVIFHCGATVNFVFPYNQLYGPNVCGTREIIRFAAHNSSACIPIQYISTISVLSAGIDKEISIDETSPDRLRGGYAQSKWVAEKLISRASKYGVPVVIYRLGLICADSMSGACNPHDLYSLLFDGMMKMSCYPESMLEFRLNGLPVDFTAKSIVYLSRMGKDGYGKIYHVINPTDEIGFEDIVDGMRRCGIEMKSVTDDEWKQELKSMSDQNGVFESLSTFFGTDAFRKRSLVSADQFWNAVYTISCPAFDKDYIFKWLNFILCNISKK